MGSVLDVLGADPPPDADKGIAQTRRRIGLPSGVQSGDVSDHEAVVWARGDGEGRLTARLSSGAHVGRVLHGPHVDATSDFTGRLDLTGLTPGRAYEAAVWFEGRDGTRGEVGHLRFQTAPAGRRATSFVWTGGTCGQGWGINPDLGGMTGYAAMHRTNPDFFVHAGEAASFDTEILAEVTEPGGQIWHNLVTPEVAVVAETLDQFRGRHRYNLIDDNLREMYADVPVVAQWDDHETHQRWYPGLVLDDERYTERRVDLLAARARRAWQEYQPIGSQAVHMRGHDGFAGARIYRRIARGQHLDLFCLDMRTFRGVPPSAAAGDPGEPHTALLGAEQSDWLVRELAASRATWKVVVADLPLGLVVPDGTEESAEIARVLRGIRDRNVRNVVWVTADAHYAAAHHYHPSRASFGDFLPFWEFVAGPINAGTFDPQPLDPTFGPEVVWQHAGDHPNQSPRGGNQFFGHVAIAADGQMTVSLRNAAGRVLYSESLDPDRP